MKLTIVALAALIAGPAAPQTLRDLEVRWTKDGACHVATIHNNLAPTVTSFAHLLVEPVELLLIVDHQEPKGPETIQAFAGDGWSAWPERIVIEDHAKGQIMVCPEVAA